MEEKTGRKRYEGFSMADPTSRTSRDPRRRAQFWLLTALYEAMKTAGLTQKGLAELLKSKTTKVAVWFYQHENARRTLPSLIVLRDLVKARWPNITSSPHGRTFNYVWIMEEKPYTNYEERLRADNARLKKELEEEQEKTRVLRQEYQRVLKESG